MVIQHLQLFCSNSMIFANCSHSRPVASQLTGDSIRGMRERYCIASLLQWEIDITDDEQERSKEAEFLPHFSHSIEQYYEYKYNNTPG